MVCADVSRSVLITLHHIQSKTSQIKYQTLNYMETTLRSHDVPQLSILMSRGFDVWINRGCFRRRCRLMVSGRRKGDHRNVNVHLEQNAPMQTDVHTREWYRISALSIPQKHCSLFWTGAEGFNQLPTSTLRLQVEMPRRVHFTPKTQCWCQRQPVNDTSISFKTGICKMSRFPHHVNYCLITHRKK